MRRSRMTRAVTRFVAAACTLGLLAAIRHAAEAIQPDAAYTELEKKRKDKWQEEDRQIDARLEQLRKKHGKSPNIIYILADDIGWGELGCYLGGKLRGTPTPVLDKMAATGMKFLSFYSEPSCTPTRLALLTGRLPVRTGVSAVLWPGQTEGLAPEEVTVAEVLKEAGYHTAFWGKWHVGELPQQAPENQGFDYAYYGLYNGAPFAWPDMQPFYEGEIVPGKGWFYDFPGVEEYKARYGIRLEGIFEGRPGQPRKEVADLSSREMGEFEDESARQIVSYIKDKAKSECPFFIYWATYTQQAASSPKEYRFDRDVDSRNNNAAQLAQHNVSLRHILDTVRSEGIAENTLVVWMSDNGPMYAFWPNSGYSWLRGEKGDVYEGGVRTPGIAWWPGVVEPGQDPLDLIHVTDLFTTAARIAGVTDKIPDDRITDGIDQTAFLLLGEGHSRRNYMFYYSGKRIGAIRYGDYKLHLFPGGGRGGLPPMEVYNIARDPRETHGSMYDYMWLVTPFQDLIKAHVNIIKKFPHRVLKPEHDTPAEAELTPHD